MLLLGLTATVPSYQPRGQTAAEPAKLALIVAVSSYPVSSGYRDLSAYNDALVMRTALKGQGFDVRIAADTEATRARILAALKELTDRAKPGDVVWIHYGGHGHQITDDANRDESDGYDEVLVPFDAVNYADSSAEAVRRYGGARHIRDDELAPILAGLRSRAGKAGNVVVTIDACFSGTATRGPTTHRVRGIDAPMGPPASRVTSRSPGTGLREVVSAQTESDLAPMVVISAARDDQKDQEITYEQDSDIGPLSYALAKALARLRPSTTYGALFEQVSTIMRAKVSGQTPQIEGARDVAVFSNRVIDQQSAFLVGLSEDRLTVTVDGGTLAGLYPGSVLSIHAAGASQLTQENQLGTARVTAAGVSEATLALDLPLTRARANGARATVRQYAFPNMRLKARLEASLGPTLSKAIADSARALGFSISAQGADVTIGPVSAGGPVGVMRPTTQTGDVTQQAQLVLGPITSKERNVAAAVATRLRAFALASNLLSQPINDPAIDVRLRLIPAALTASSVPCADTTRPTSARNVNGTWHLKNQGFDPKAPIEGYMLEIINNGTARAYVTILDIASDYGIRVIVPREQEVPEAVNAGERYVRDACYFATPPLGSETLLLVATRQPIDFRSILTRGKTETRGAMSDFERALASMVGASRSRDGDEAKGLGSMFGLTIEVLP